MRSKKCEEEESSNGEELRMALAYVIQRQDTDIKRLTENFHSIMRLSFNGDKSCTSCGKQVHVLRKDDLDVGSVYIGPHPTDL